jgi:hypothetical protein
LSEEENIGEVQDMIISYKKMKKEKKNSADVPAG